MDTHHNNFKEKYKLAREREEFMIQYCHRSKHSYINDALGVISLPVPAVVGIAIIGSIGKSNLL